MDSSVFFCTFARYYATIVITMKNIAFIVNPISGTKTKNRLAKLIRELLDPVQFSPTVVVTEYAGHATQLAQQFAAQDYYAVVAVGGDGTVNEVASGLIGTNTALGIIPNGSGNGFARHLDISTRMNRAIEMLNSSEPICVDYGMVNDDNLEEILNCDVICLVTGSKAYELNLTREFIEKKLLVIPGIRTKLRILINLTDVRFYKRIVRQKWIINPIRVGYFPNVTKLGLGRTRFGKKKRC